MKYRIKQVPKTQPNADGEWIEADIPGPLPTQGLYDFLGHYCSPGFFAVQYVEEKSDDNAS